MTSQKWLRPTSSGSLYWL